MTSTSWGQPPEYPESDESEVESEKSEYDFDTDSNISESDVNDSNIDNMEPESEGKNQKFTDSICIASQNHFCTFLKSFSISINS